MSRLAAASVASLTEGTEEYALELLMTRVDSYGEGLNKRFGVEEVGELGRVSTFPHSLFDSKVKSKSKDIHTVRLTKMR